MLNQNNLKFRKAKDNELEKIVTLLLDDELGSKRESLDDLVAYQKALDLILKDQNQYLMVVDDNEIIKGTCHLTIMPSLIFKGSTRLNIEAVRIQKNSRGQGLGEWMIKEAIQFANEKNCKIIQLATNNKRSDALRFYKKLGFESSHVGLKMYLNQSE